MSKKILDDELCLPPTATLTHSSPSTLICGTTPIALNVTISLRRTSDPSPRCILVGRQAKTADIRIDHGSISRRHAALYYDGGTLVLKDLGGKHGTQVNGVRVEKNGTRVLEEGDLLMFGNVREKTFVVGKMQAANAGGEVDKAGKQAEAKLSESSAGNGDEAVTVTEEEKEERKQVGAGLTGRAKREAEIRAMMDSLKEAPSYQKYHPPPEEEGEDGGTTASDAAMGNVSAADATAAPSTMQPAQSDLITRGHSIPVSHRTLIASPSNSKSRVVMALALDPAGSRFATGCTDTHLYLYDFGGMDASHRHFKEIEVEEGHPIVDCCYSNTGDRILVGTGSAQPKVLDRDGRELVHFIKGDMYVTDQARTTGHTAGVTAVAWHPFERDLVLTSSLDGSARLWNLNGKTQFKKLMCGKVFRAKNARGQRTGVSAVVFHPAGRELALGTVCGSIQIWNATSLGTRPEKVVYDAHGPGRPVNSVVFNSEGTVLASRSVEDDTLKVWDAKSLFREARPIAAWAGVPGFHEGNNSAFSPNGRVLCAGTVNAGRQQKQGTALLKFFKVPGRDDPDRGRGGHEENPLLEMDVAQGTSVVRVAWHAKLNQVFVGCSNGCVCIFYDPDLSSKGALLSTAKAARQKDELSLLLASRAPQGSAAVTGEILTPHALPMFRDKEKDTKRKREKERADPVKSRRPEPPASGVKTGGQTSASVNFTQFVVKSTIRNKNIAGKDPREELFKYSEGKSYVSQAYEGDRQIVLTDKTAEQEEEEMKDPKT